MPFRVCAELLTPDENHGARDHPAKLRNCDILAASHRENCNMPTTVSLYLIGVWFCVGFFTGAGWALAAWIVGRFLRF